MRLASFMKRVPCRFLAPVMVSTGLWMHANAVEVERWGIHEMVLKGPDHGNPFTEVRFEASFSCGRIHVDVPGFYDGNGEYRIRFSPPEEGRWKWRTHSNVPDLDGRTGEFVACAPGPGNHGPVRVANGFHFSYADGTPFKPVGTTIYNWIDAPGEIQELTLSTLAAAPFNKARMLLTQQPKFYQNKIPPERWPYAGAPPDGWNLERFNTDYFRHYEGRIARLRDLGIQADLILFNPYGKWGFESMDRNGDERYIRYVVARFGAYRNVWWSLANEYDYIKGKTEEDWNHLGGLLMECDPHQRLRSIHNGTRIFDHGRNWITHASIQNGFAVEEPGRAQLYRDVWRKPVIYDEVKYEGDSPRRWGNLGPREMVHRFWCGTVAGTYVGHGEHLRSQSNQSWTSFGGSLSGESAPRIAFLKKILDDSPAQGIDPIDKWQDDRTAGVPGLYYLTYFGRETPAEWRFRLFRNGVAEGQRYQVEVIDTWNMTITPVEKVFVTKKLDAYHFVDAADSVVTLPRIPGNALRVRRIDPDPRPVTAVPLEE